MSTVDRILVLGGPSGPLGRLVADVEGVEAVAGLDECLARLGEASPGDRALPMVVVDPTVPRPMAAVQRLRSAARDVGIVVAVASTDVATMESKLAFVPEVDDVHVVAADVEVEPLRERLEQLAGLIGRRRGLRGALDAMNRDLGAPAPTQERQRAPMRSVSAHYLAALVRHAADTIVSVDPIGRVVTINDAGLRTLGVDSSEAEGRPLRALLADDDPGHLQRLLEEATTGTAPSDDEVMVRLRSGHELLLSATGAPVLDDVGQLAGLVLVARDVTAERRAAQRLQALQKAESLATLASGVAHDFNNLLVQAQGWADLAAEDPGDRELVASALERIGQATRRASELARTMLAYGGRGRFEPRRLDLAELLLDLEPLLAATTPAKIELHVEPAGSPQVRGDASQLRQVVLNLVTNAVEAIGDDEGRIEVRLAELTDATATGGLDPTHFDDVDVTRPASGRAVLEVADTGPGIEVDVQERLFDPFFTTKFTGRGLGLAASHGIIAAHGGSLTVDSRPGAGATFRLELPTIGGVHDEHR